MTNIYINGQLIDLFEEEDIAQSFSIGSFGDIASRGSSYSNTFKIPLTANNLTIFGLPHIITNVSFVPYQSLACEIEVDGTVVVDGLAELVSITDVLSVRVFGGNYDFYTIIKGKYLTDLDLSSYNHTWNKANVIASRANTSGYIYPMIDYHTDSPNAYISNANNDIDTRFMYFSFYLHTLISKIISEAGFTISGSVMSNTDYLAIALPFSNDRYIGAFSDGYRALNSSQQALTVFEETIQFNNDSTNGGYDTGGNYNTGTYKYTVATNITAKFILSLTLSCTVGLGITTIHIRRQRGSAISYFLKTSIVQNPGETETFVLTTAELSFLAGDIIYATATNGTSVGSVVIQPLSYIEVVASEVATYGGDIDVTLNMPKIKQGDLFKLFLQKFGAFVQVNNDTKVITIKQFSEIASNTLNAKDWSNKLDETDDPEIRFSFEKYAQVNKFLYKEDENVAKPNGTDYDLLVNNENLDLEKDFLISPFAASEQVLRLPDKSIVNIGKVTAAVLKQKTEPRLVYIRREDFSVDYVDNTGTTNVTTNIPLTHFILEGQTFNLGWSNSLSDNLTDIENCLDLLKIITVLLRLNSVDINTLDLFIPVYIEKFEAYFYISKINQYKVNRFDSTRVELVKLN